MSRIGLPAVRLGNEFWLPQPKLQVCYHSLIFALSLLLVGISGIYVASRYWSAHALSQVKPAAALPTQTRAISGLNLTVPAEQFPAKLQTITNQPASLTVGSKTVPVSPETIKSWLQINSNTQKTEYYVHIKADTIAKSLTTLAGKQVKTPRNQVTITHGGASQVVIGGINGTRLSDPTTLNTQAAAVAKTLMDAKGLQFSTPLETVPFQSLTPANFNKLIEVNVVTKHMYLYENGQLLRSYPISAGAPKTPTILGQYKIYSKPRVQDMRGFNPDGTKYFQPKVKWINYFAPGGYAIHGNYWRPTSWFGAVNSSHGCVSLPDSQAKEVYDWASIGTTVINHT